MNLRSCLIVSAIILTAISCDNRYTPRTSSNDLVFNYIPASWDEGIPLGNGTLGALVWGRDSVLRISLDRIDLWDLRPMDNLDFSNFDYSWVCRQWEENTYYRVQEMMDVPYDRRVAPTKIPGAAMEFDISSLGKAVEVRLSLKDAMCEIRWEGGATLQLFVNAVKDEGWYRFSGIKSPPQPVIIPPAYTIEAERGEKNIGSEAGLTLLGYPQGTIIDSGNHISYLQDGWGDFSYNVATEWVSEKEGITGCWCISSTESDSMRNRASELVSEAVRKGSYDSFVAHRNWWDSFWSRSSVSVPDTLLQKQYMLEMYKFGSAARADSPPISLQSVWTADNGRLPPWKGDFHHDLNTQLSYWPSYTGNHTDLAEGFVNWLWDNKPVFEKYTREYYHSDGLNVPGVTTLRGEPMGGWIQYSLGPTVSAWLAHHFYLQWKYTMDRTFLEERAWPWLEATVRHLSSIAVRGDDGLLKLPLSSSPEIHDNSREAWFDSTTNFDLALIRWTYTAAAEMAEELGYSEKSRELLLELDRWPGFATDSTGLMFAPGHPYAESHRHFSHLMAWHPMGLIDYSNSPGDREIIDNTLATLEKYGSDYWVGYSFSWEALLFARAFRGDDAAEKLTIFAEAFTLPNSFHVNGDQTGKGYSRFTYRPFTLEGNFAFAAALQEMLIQSHTGVIQVFPAIPGSWDNLSFTNLRCRGALLVSAAMEKGEVTSLTIESEKGGVARILKPFNGNAMVTGGNYTMEDNILVINIEQGEKVILKQE